MILFLSFVFWIQEKNKKIINFDDFTVKEFREKLYINIIQILIYANYASEIIQAKISSILLKGLTRSCLNLFFW